MSNTHVIVEKHILYNKTSTLQVAMGIGLTTWWRCHKGVRGNLLDLLEYTIRYLLVFNNRVSRVELLAACAHQHTGRHPSTRLCLALTLSCLVCARP